MKTTEIIIKMVFFILSRNQNESKTDPMNPKQQRRSKKISNIADLATNLIFACCGFRLQCRECTVWPRNAARGRELQRCVFGVS